MKPYSNFAQVQHDLQHGITSCRELVTYFLANIDRKKHLNAFLSVYREEALLRAEAIDLKIKKRNRW